ncbi:MAG: phosphoglycerate kinase [Patescibacteria group bacterium]|nr:phosphoglycerate kinase [Patescibacteria group bacterium]
MSEIKSITSVPTTELKGKRVIVRCDFNVQVFEGKIMDDLRVRKTLPTIQFLRDAGARVILISHIESKDGTGLKPVCEYINETYTKECGVVTFVSDFQSEDAASTIANMKDGEITLIENLRIDAREKSNDIEFAKLLASYADIYVNDAFAVSHRAHASVVGLPALFPNARYAGIQLMNELDHLKVTFNAPHPFVFILGGAKFETKLPLIQKFAQADSILLGGALLNDILKAKGYNVGKSLVSSGVDTAGAKIDFTPIIENPKLIIPDDVIVSGILPDGTIRTSTKLISEVGDEDMIMDVGPSMNTKLTEVIQNAKFILWNGPMGNYEKGFKDQTIEMAKLVSMACSRLDAPVRAVLGGGDTTAAMIELGLEDQSDKGNDAMFISTGGGAMLEYLLNESLPGVEVLRE